MSKYQIDQSSVILEKKLYVGVSNVKNGICDEVKKSKQYIVTNELICYLDFAKKYLHK